VREIEGGERFDTDWALVWEGGVYTDDLSVIYGAIVWVTFELSGVDIDGEGASLVVQDKVLWGRDPIRCGCFN